MLGAGERPTLAFILVNPTSGDIGRFLRHTLGIEGRAAGFLLSRPISPGGQGGTVPPPSLFRVGGGGFGARNEAQKGRIRVAFFARADYKRLKND